MPEVSPQDRWCHRGSVVVGPARFDDGHQHPPMLSDLRRCTLADARGQPSDLLFIRGFGVRVPDGAPALTWASLDHRRYLGRSGVVCHRDCSGGPRGRGRGRMHRRPEVCPERSACRAPRTSPATGRLSGPVTRSVRGGSSRRWRPRRSFHDELVDVGAPRGCPAAERPGPSRTARDRQPQSR